jgi:hypothetical protein
MKKIIDFVVKYPVAITAFVCLIFYFLPFKPKPFGDGEYHNGTLDLIAYIINGFEGNIRVYKGILTLFYYFIPYSLAYIFHNDTIFYHFSIAFNILVICLSVGLIFKTFDILHFSNKSKFWTIVILNLFPIHIYYVMGILAETAAFFSISLFVFAITKINSGYLNYRNIILLSFSLLLLTGVRPNLLPFTVVFLLYFLLQKIEWRYRATALFFVAGSSLALLTFEKSVSTEDESFKSNAFGNQIVWSRFELRDEPFNWMPQHGPDEYASKDYWNNLKKRHELDSICKVNHFDRTTYFIKWVKDDIAQNPLLTLRQYSLKFFQSQSFIISPLMKSDKNQIVKYGVHIYVNLINYILVFCGIYAMYQLFKRKNFKLFIPFLLLWGWSLLYVFVFHSEQRYMFPTRPVLIFLFAFAITSLSEKKNVPHKKI